MKSESKQLPKMMRRRLAILLVCALVLTMLPMGDLISAKATASATEKEVSASGKNARTGYGVSNPTTDDDGVTTWDTIYFGNYWQNDTNGDGIADQNDDKEPVKWRVLSVDGDDAFLLADQNLDCQPYNDEYQDVTWETCTLRSWLNDSFINHAFTAAEQSAIMDTTVKNPDNPEYGTGGGNDTTDKVYLLSIDEATNPEYGFSSNYGGNKSRWAKNTEYAKEQGAYTSTVEYAGNGVWWLRSPGISSNFASGVNYDGYVSRYGDCVHDSNMAARAALHLNLSSATGWSYGGTVNSEGISSQNPDPSPTATAKPTLAPTVSPAASPVATGHPGIGPTEKPDVTPGTTASPEPQIPGSETERPTIKPNDNTPAPPSGSVPGQPVETQPASPSKTGEDGKDKQDAPVSQTKAGTVMTISGTEYKIQSTSGKEKTVVFLKAADKKLKKAAIPGTVKYKSGTYKVVKISKNAFKGCKNLTNVTIGKNVKVIGSGAFKGCKKLKTVQIRSTVLKKIGTGAFAGISPKAKLKAPKSKIRQYRRLMEKAGFPRTKE